MLRHPVAIIGANGFIGKHLMKAIPDAIPVIKETTINKKLPNTIFNVAGYAGTDLKKSLETNLYLVTDWLREMNKDAIFINAGTSMEYIDTAAPPETAPASGRGIYGQSKAMAAAMMALHGSSGLPCANLRLYCVYGEGDRPGNLIPTILREAKHGRLPPFVNGHTTRDFVHVDDVCRAFILAASNLKSNNYGESFNIGTGVATPIKKVAEISEELFDITAEYTRPFGENDAFSWYCNPEKAEKLLGFKTRVSFEEGFRNLAKA